MAITINGSGTVTGISVGGLPDGIVDQDMLASGVPAITTTSGTNNFTVADGDLVIGTSGHGISFAATSDGGGMTSELFTDYEEGTWTPTIAGGFGSITYVDQKGAYIRVGNLVTAWLRIVTNTATANSNAFSLALPFTAKNYHGAGEQPMGGAIIHSTHAEITDGNWHSLYITDGDSNVTIQEFSSSGCATVLGASSYSSSNRFIQAWVHYAV